MSLVDRMDSFPVQGIDEFSDTLHGVLTSIGKQWASDAEIQVAIDEWLEHNEPSPNVRFELEVLGYIKPSERTQHAA